MLPHSDCPSRQFFPLYISSGLQYHTQQSYAFRKFLSGFSSFSLVDSVFGNSVVPFEVTSAGFSIVSSTESTSEKEEKPDEEPEKEPSICYTTHIQDIGWQNQVKDGEMAGTEGQAKRLEAIKITLKDLSGVKIKYQTHIQDIGWQDWKYDGTLAGTEGQSKRLEAIKIELEENDKYSIMYRVQIVLQILL